MMHNKNQNKITFGSDSGFTIFEVVIVMVLTSLLAGIFAETMTSSMEIYTQHNFRKTAHIDMKRAMDAMVRDLRSCDDWQHASQEVDHLHFEKFNRYQTGGGTTYYDDDDEYQYEFVANSIEHRREYTTDRINIWGNKYDLLQDDLNTASSAFTLTDVGGNDLLTIVIYITVNNTPMRMRTSVFPRKQGG